MRFSMQFYSSILYLQQEHWLLFLFIVFIFSLLVGSFLNVVIYRVPEIMKRDWQLQAKLILAEGDEVEQERLLAESAKAPTFNIAVPASKCPKCDSAIKPWQNIPVLSYLFLRGKCANCQVPISPRYPLIEFFTGLLAVAVYWHFGLVPEALCLLLMSYVFVALFWIDMDHQLLPDSMTLPLLWFGLLINTQGLFVDLQTAVIGAAVGYLSLWSVYWLFKLVTGKEGMGFGDFKLMAAIGAWFGWQIIPQVILWSALVGAVIGVGLIVVQGRDKQKPMPYGPFIAAAAWLLVVFEQPIAALGLPF